MQKPADPVVDLFAEMLRSRLRRAPHEVLQRPSSNIACGARLGWLIDVDAKHAWVYRPGRPVESIEDASSLQGDPELPGLRVEVATLA
jgi:Uma2 family endonuclease